MRWYVSVAAFTLSVPFQCQWRFLDSCLGCAHHASWTLVGGVQGLEDLRAEGRWDDNPFLIHDNIIKDVEPIHGIPEILKLIVKVRCVLAGKPF